MNMLCSSIPVFIQRVFGPWFKVPTQKELEEDKEKLDEQFQAGKEGLSIGKGRASIDSYTSLL